MMLVFPRLLGLLLILPLITTFIPAQREYFTVKGSDFLENTTYIFTGKLIDKKSYWSEDGRSIMTRHVFDVQDSVKGAPGGTVTITEYGGTVGNRSMTLSHSCNYLLGQGVPGLHLCRPAQPQPYLGWSSGAVSSDLGSRGQPSDSHVSFPPSQTGTGRGIPSYFSPSS